MCLLVSFGKYFNVSFFQGVNELDLTTFVYGGVNITGFSVVDNASAENVELLNDAKAYQIHKLHNITVGVARLSWA